MNSILNNKDKVKVLLLVVVIGSIIGFIYEEIFYYFDLGYLVKRGFGFGPWILIYGVGSLFIYLLGEKFKENKILTILICFLIPTILEFIVGYVLYHGFNIRLWDYNNEILNFANLGGYICLRSVLFFLLGGLFLIYILVPILEKFVKKFKRFSNISYVMGSVFFIDVIFNYLIKQTWR